MTTMLIALRVFSFLALFVFPIGFSSFFHHDYLAGDAMKFYKHSKGKDASWSVFVPAPTDAMAVKNCGGSKDLSCHIDPWPIVNQQEVYVECNMTAAHTFDDGNIIFNFNKWPFNVEKNLCIFTKDHGSPLCPVKKGDILTGFFSGKLNFPTVYWEQTFGNITVVNRKGELMGCVSFLVNHM